MKNDKQRTAQWFKDRQNKLTASMFGQAAGLGPGSRQSLWRRLHGLETLESNEAMQWGENNEGFALEAHQRIFGNAQNKEDYRLYLVGFVVHPTMPWLGASPDGLLGKDGLLEVKCPFNQKVYDDVPIYYMAQVQGQLRVTGRKWAHFLCWTPHACKLWIIPASNEYWDWLHLRLSDFWSWYVAGVEPPRAARPKDKEIPTVISQIIYDGETPPPF